MSADFVTMHSNVDDACLKINFTGNVFTRTCDKTDVKSAFVYNADSRRLAGKITIYLTANAIQLRLALLRSIDVNNRCAFIVEELCTHLLSFTKLW